MSQKIEETCKRYSEKEIPEKYIIFEKIFLASKGPFRYLDASTCIWQYGGQYEWEKPLHQMMMDYSIHKVSFLDFDFIATSYLKKILFFIQIISMYT